ncbi:hypothetical protein [Peptoniphilus catoniae]|uniref:hypothetical protein n=1 Tax=Peptoniphilus catoniae TaxID=1660341 RepID=UPI0010FD7EB8|nr:hypothetical protein [Peptoniphilus catoniae]
MVLEIRYLKNLERPWLIKRADGDYSQHSHMKRKKDVEKVKHLIEIKKYPDNKDQRIAMERLLTEDEFRSLNKRQRYININKGLR